MDSASDPDATNQPFSKRRGRPLGADSAATRQAILFAATEVFWQQGYQGTTLGTIAQRVGIGSSALYHYFSSKHELYCEAAKHCASEVYEALYAALSKKDEIHERITALIEVAKAFHAASNSTALFVGGCSWEIARNPDLEDLGRNLHAMREDLMDFAFHSEAKSTADRIRAKEAEYFYRMVHHGFAAISVQNIGIDEFDRHADAMAVIASRLFDPSKAAPAAPMP